MKDHLSCEVIQGSDDKFMTGSEKKNLHKNVLYFLILMQHRQTQGCTSPAQVWREELFIKEKQNAELTKQEGLTWPQPVKTRL